MRNRKKGLIVLLIAFILIFFAGNDTILTAIPGEAALKDKKYNIDIDKNNLYIYVEGEKQPVVIKNEGNYSRIISNCVSDINNDKADEILVLLGKQGSNFGECLLIISFLNGNIGSIKQSGIAAREIYRGSFARLNPWKVQVSDVDGDGEKEISIGVYKTAKFHPVPAKRPFIYNWHDGKMSPKWLGSRLSRPFDDYIFSDIDGDGSDELISIEFLSNGDKVINSYKWKGFGFEGAGETCSFEDISEIQEEHDIKGCQITGRIKVNGKWEWTVFHYKNGSFENKKIEGKR